MAAKVRARPELSQALRRHDDLQPRRRRGRHRLPVAGVGDHPQPAADRPRRRRPAPAVAAVHAARRRHHRPQRPAPVDGRRQRGPRRADRGRRGRRARPPGRHRRARRDRAGRRDRVVPVRRAIIVATLLLGTCEVLYDNSAQTFMPAIVDAEHLERANGRMYSAEIVANQFLGPPLASLLLAAGSSLPFVVRRRTFAAVGRASCSRSSATKRAPRPPTTRRAPALQGGAGRGVPLAVAPPPAAHVRHRPRRPQPARAR